MKKKSKKKVAKKAAKKKAAPKTVSAKLEIVVRQPDQNQVPASALLPQVSGTKYMIPKTWVSEKQVLQMLQRTPQEHIYSRPGKGGGTFTYVTGAYVKKVLNFVFGWGWDFMVEKYEIMHPEKNGHVIVLGKLTVKDDHGHQITKMQFGRADIKYLKGSNQMVDLGNDLKAASTDALKKCASEFGIASDVYGSQEFREIGKVIVEKPTAPSVPAKPVIVSPSKAVEAGIAIDCQGGCGAVVSKQVAEYSKKMFKGKILCRDCQTAERNRK